MLQQSFDVNAMVSDFKWPQTWVSDIAVDQQLGQGFLGTLEADLRERHQQRVRAERRPGGAGADPARRAAVLRRRRRRRTGAQRRRRRRHLRDRQHQRRLQLQRHGPAPEELRRSGSTPPWATASPRRRTTCKSTEIASVLWQSQPIQGNPNNPELSYSEFGQRHRIVGGATYVKSWSRDAPYLDRPLRRGGGGQSLRGRGRQPVLVHLLRAT